MAVAFDDILLDVIYVATHVPNAHVTLSLRSLTFVGSFPTMDQMMALSL